VCLTHIPFLATVYPAHAPDATAAKATTAKTMCATNVRPDAGRAVAATTMALDPTVSAATLADCAAKYCVMSLLAIPEVSKRKYEKRNLTETRVRCTRYHSVRTPKCGRATAPWDWFDHLPLSPGHSVDVVSPERRS
jgi:hypothetical protein